MVGVSDLASRLAAARTGAAVGPVLEGGLLRFAGTKRQVFLHRLSTQDLSGLRAGQSAYAAFLESRGHLVGEGTVLVRPDEILVCVAREAAAATRDHLRKYVLREDVQIEDLSEKLRVVPALGPRGAATARERAGTAPLAENARRGAPCLDAYLPAGEAGAFRDALAAAGAVPLGEADLEALRIEEGLARFGADMDGSRLPMEAGLTRSAIHFGKGCYIGQEIVLRATVRGHLQKGLVQLELPPAAGPGARLRAGGQEVGVVTSAAETTRGRLGLGYVRRAHWREGERLAADGGEAVVRRVLVQETAG